MIVVTVPTFHVPDCVAATVPSTVSDPPLSVTGIEEFLISTGNGFADETARNVSEPSSQSTAVPVIVASVSPSVYCVPPPNEVI